uniref:Uncharacterized protein n=1 Tax=Rhizophora mucronata TaxID=61149 RepID=A0A2P2QSZ8_RHIMU
MGASVSIQFDDFFGLNGFVLVLVDRSKGLNFVQYCLCPRPLQIFCITLMTVEI